MSAITHLSNVMLMQLFKDWLLFKEVGNLDSALCNSSDRKGYLHAFQVVSMLVDGSLSYQASEVFINWLSMRNLSVRHLNLRISNSLACRLTRLPTNQFPFADRLETLSISGICPLNVPVLCKMALSLCALLELRISGCRFADDTFLSAMTAQTASLTSLELNSCGEVSDNAFMGLARRCRRLSELSLVECDGISNATVQLVVTQCAVQKITLLRCTKLTVGCVHDVLRYCKDVTVLRLDGLAVSVADVVRIGKAYSTLQSLSLRNTAIDPATANDNLPSKGRLFPALRSLDVSGNGKFTDAFFGSLLASTNSASLTELRISRCNALSVASLFAIATSLTGLTALDISYVACVADVAVGDLAREMGPRLLSLSVAGCRKVNNSSVNALNEHCRNLTALDISHCASITTAPVLRLLESHPKMVSLNIAQCKGVDEVKVDHHIVNNIMTCKLHE